jgi:hypothetical protein
MSKKSLPPVYYLEHNKFPDGINQANYKVIKDTLQSAVDMQWKKTKTVNELRSRAGMTVRQARELVKSELADTRRWEDEEE